MREYAEQLMIFVVGLLGAALILYVGKIFAPYIYPAAMAALISIPIAALNRRINRLLAQDLLNKLRACLRAKCLLVLGALLLSISSLAGLHLAILVLTGIIMALLALHRLGPKMFLLVTIVGTGSVSQLLLTNCFHEVILLSTDVVQRHSKFDAAFIDNIYASFETVDSVMKSNFGVGLYEAGTMAVRLLEEKSEEIDSNNKSGGERPPPKNGQEASAQLIAELDRLRGQLTAARVISRVRDLLSYEQLMRAAIYFARLLSTALRLLVGSAQRIIQGITFVYFLFYFIGQQESVLRYVAAPFVRVPEVQVFVRETEAAFEFVVRQYAEQVLGQIALSYVVFRACNVRLAMVLAMLAGLLEIFPLMPPTVVTLLAAAEIFFAGSMPVAILCILVHALINWLLMPRLILFKSPRSGYFAELSILVGFWTFGWVGLVLGPVLACIPAIIYRLFTGETVMGEGLTSSSPVDGEAMVLSAIYFLDLKGKVLLSRDYRGDVSPEAADRFITLLSEMEEQQVTATPIITSNNITYIYIRHANLYGTRTLRARDNDGMLALTKRNSNVMSILLFLHRVVGVFTEYFRELEEESLRDNFVIVYELLDEMMDFGHVQSTETNILKEYITQQSFQLESSGSRIPPSAITSTVSWRSEGIKYRKNEVFLDVIESLNLLVNSNGNVVQSEIVGSVKVRCYLSGMPELKLGLNDRVLFETTGRAARSAGASSSKTVDLEDVKFHQCVRLAKFESDRTISFIPPDGEFELMSYRMTPQSSKPPIWVECIIERWSSSRIEYLIKARSQLKKRTNANAVEVIIPVPEDADTPKFKTTVGTATYEPERGAIIWTIGFFPSGKEFSLRARFGFSSVKADEVDRRDGQPVHKPLLPISVNFEIPYYTASGIQVRYLKIVEKSGYPALPWVRYITQNGDYLLRMPEQYRL